MPGRTISARLVREMHRAVGVYYLRGLMVITALINGSNKLKLY